MNFCLKYQSKNFDIIVNIEKLSFKKRYTKKNYEINLNLLDKKKTEISIRANWAHAIEGGYTRDINENTRTIYFTIHDCFMVDSLEVSNFIAVANRNFKLNEVKEIEFIKEKITIFSIFIFI